MRIRSVEVFQGVLQAIKIRIDHGEFRGGLFWEMFGLPFSKRRCGGLEGFVEMQSA